MKKECRRGEFNRKVAIRFNNNNRINLKKQSFKESLQDLQILSESFKTLKIKPKSGDKLVLKKLRNANRNTLLKLNPTELNNKLKEYITANSIAHYIKLNKAIRKNIKSTENLYHSADLKPNLQESVKTLGMKNDELNTKSLNEELIRKKKKIVDHRVNYIQKSNTALNKSELLKSKIRLINNKRVDIQIKRLQKKYQIHNSLSSFYSREFTLNKSLLNPSKLFAEDSILIYNRNSLSKIRALRKKRLSFDIEI